MFLEAPGLLWLLILAAVPWWLTARIRGRDPSHTAGGRAYLRGSLLGLTVVASAVAGAGPRRAVPGGAALDAGTDVVIVLDVSMSMLADDVHPSRLGEASRQLIERFGRRVDEPDAPRRIGVVLFGGDARVACPLTGDRVAVRQALESASEEGAAAGGSDISAGLTRAVSMLAASRQSGAIVLVTDGDQGPGTEAEPADTARELAARNIKLSVVGVGSVEGATIPVRGAGRDKVVEEADGRPRLSKLDEARLRAIAAAGRGRYEALDVGPLLLTTLVGAKPASAAGNGPFGPVLWHGIPLAVALMALTADTMLWWFGRPRGNWS